MSIVFVYLCLFIRVRTVIVSPALPQSQPNRKKGVPNRTLPFSSLRLSSHTGGQWHVARQPRDTPPIQPEAAVLQSLVPRRVLVLEHLLHAASLRCSPWQDMYSHSAFMDLLNRWWSAFTRSMPQSNEAISSVVSNRSVESSSRLAW
jgi:hypothetical protein